MAINTVNNALNIKNLEKVGQIQPGDFLLVEVPEGSRIIDFKNFIIGKDNITFATELSTFSTNIDLLLSRTNTLTSALFFGDQDLITHTLSASTYLSAGSGIYINDVVFGHNGNIGTVTTHLSSNGILYASGGDSNNWNNTYTAVSPNSSNWTETYTRVNAYSANWNLTFNQMSTVSAEWDSTHSTVNTSSASWGGESSKWIEPGGSTTFLTNSSNKVGIGLDSGLSAPDEKLTVKGNISASGTLKGGANSTSTHWDDTYTTVYSNSASWGSAGVPGWVSGGGTNIVSLVDSTDSVGIGTATPNEKLTVVGDISAQGDLHTTGILYVPQYITHTGDSNTYIDFTDDDINITVGGMNMLDFTEGTTDEITFNESAQQLDVRIESEADPNLFFTDGSQNKVGIGTATPNEKLTVVGNISASGDIIASDSSFKWAGGETWAAADATGVKTNSASWDTASTKAAANEADITNIASVSALWDDVQAKVVANSGDWGTSSSTNTVLQTSSAVWNSVGSVVTGASGNWNTSYNDKINSITWDDTTGIITFTQQDATTLTVDIDGRYAQSATLATSYIPYQTSTGLNDSVIQQANSKIGIGFLPIGSSSTFSVLGDISASGSLSVAGGTVLTTSDLVAPQADIDLMGALSASWTSVFNTNTANSGVWQSVSNEVTGTSANWNSVYTSYNSDSGIWNATTNAVTGTSGNWDTGYSKANLLGAASASWDSVYTSYNSDSGIWYAVAAAVTGTSGNWDTGYSKANLLGAASAKWDSTQTDVHNTSSNWTSAYNHFVSNVTFNTSTGQLTFTRNDGTTFIRSIDGRYANASVGEVQAGSVYTSVNVNSAVWQSVASEVTGTSANWNGAVLDINNELGPASASWNSVYTNSNANSSVWQSVSNEVTGTSANWNLSHLAITTDVKNNSANWVSVFNSNQTYSGDWQDVVSDVNTYSGDWQDVVTDTNANSAKWVAVHTDVNANSAVWQSVASEVTGTSANWNANYTDTNANSAVWQSVSNEVTGSSANWNNAWTKSQANEADITNMGGASGNWNEAYTNHLTGAAFNTSDGVLTLTQKDGGTVTVDLDGRYSSDALAGDASSVYTTTQNNSAVWQSVANEVTGTSASWNSVYTSTKANSGVWNSVSTEVTGSSANWNLAYSSVSSDIRSASSNWDNAYNQITDSSTDLSVDGILLVDKSAHTVGINGITTAETLTVSAFEGGISRTAFKGSQSIIDLYAGATTKFTIDASTSNTSISRTGSNKIDFVGTDTVEVIAANSVVKSDQTSTDSILNLYSRSATTDPVLKLTGSNISNEASISVDTDGGGQPMLLKRNGHIGLSINDAGKVGIGEGDADTIFHINATTPVFKIEASSASDTTIEFWTTTTKEANIYFDQNDNRLKINATQAGGTISFGTGNTEDKVIIDASGNITVGASKTVDGRDISADGTALDAEINHRLTNISENTANWNYVATNSANTDISDVVANSGIWMSVSTEVTGSSANWNLAYSSVNSDIRPVSSDWNNAWIKAQANEADISNIASSSASWDTAATKSAANETDITAIEADINNIAGTSGNWDNAWIKSQANEADISNIASTSANWNLTHTSITTDVKDNSANWDLAYTAAGEISPVSGTWVVDDGSTHFSVGNWNHIPLWSFTGGGETRLANSVMYQKSNNIGVGIVPSNGKLHVDNLLPTNVAIYANGVIKSTGDIIAYTSSDRRLKNNIQHITSSLAKVDKLNGVVFEWDKEKSGRQGIDAGLIAQDVEEVLPFAVTTREDGYKAVDYDAVIPLMVEAIKDLKQEVDSLREQLNDK